MTAVPARFPATPTDMSADILNRSSHFMEIGARLTFAGHLDAERLRRAVRLSLDAQPVLGCGFRSGWRSAWWEQLSDLDSCVPFSAIESADAERECLRLQAEGVPREGPQVVLLLVRGQDNDDVCVEISHTVADGQGAKDFLYLLARLYTRLGVEPTLAADPDPTPRPAPGDVLRALSREQRRASAKAKAPVMPNWDVPHSGVSGEGRSRRVTAFEPPTLASIREYGSQRGASVNDMLLTAFFRALIRSFDPPCGKPLSFTSTADHRRFLPSNGPLPISNLSLSGFLSLERVDGECFEATLRRVSACMREWKATCYGVQAYRGIESLARLGYSVMSTVLGLTAGMGSGKSLPLFTNMGILDEDRLRFDEAAPIAAHMLGPGPGGGSMVPTISTYRDALTISMGFCEHDLDPDLIEGVLQHMAEELDATSAAAGQDACASSHAATASASRAMRP